MAVIGYLDKEDVTSFEYLCTLRARVIVEHTSRSFAFVAGSKKSHAIICSTNRANEYGWVDAVFRV